MAHVGWKGLLTRITLPSDVMMTISSAAASVDSKVTITCNFDQFTGTGTPTIAWFKDNTAFTTEMNKAVSEGDNCGDLQRNRYIIDKAAITNTGKYKCKATYTVNSKQVVLEPAAEQDFHVRSVTVAAAEYHINVGGDIVLVCTVNGDEPKTFKWYKKQ